MCGCDTLSAASTSWLHDFPNSPSMWDSRNASPLLNWDWEHQSMIWPQSSKGVELVGRCELCYTLVRQFWYGINRPSFRPSCSIVRDDKEFGSRTRTLYTHCCFFCFDRDFDWTLASPSPKRNVLASRTEKPVRLCHRLMIPLIFLHELQFLWKLLIRRFCRCIS